MENRKVITEERLVDMEIKIARQEDLVDTLNQMVYQQQKKIDELEALCAALARRVIDVSSADSERNPANEKPPHY
ncbi:MAG: SlyX protein [Burkholderiales bacterium RIFCSPLOWO2_02_FULL_57_36]|nr:MAG: SlyX protein [Burkholderiales bacterium RIFCSPLOWO2_02_FULL_57_36]